mmetsp:Transcript_93218/g.240907  ORF Transcript_93218/g.240907 Transcript_93218/m.240907 type:complete len:450 (+) Transcript_93218:350-1699(+)
MASRSTSIRAVSPATSSLERRRLSCSSSALLCAAASSVCACACSARAVRSPREARSSSCCKSALCRRALAPSVRKRAQARLRSSGVGGVPAGLASPAVGLASVRMAAATATNASRSCFVSEAPWATSSAFCRAASRVATAVRSDTSSCSKRRIFSWASLNSRCTSREATSSSLYLTCSWRSCAHRSWSSLPCSSARRSEVAWLSSSATRARSAAVSPKSGAPPLPPVPPALCAEQRDSSSRRRETSLSKVFVLSACSLRRPSSTCLWRSVRSSYWRSSESFSPCTCSSLPSTSPTRRFFARTSCSSCSQRCESLAMVAASRPASFSACTRPWAASRPASSRSTRRLSPSSRSVRSCRRGPVALRSSAAFRIPSVGSTSPLSRAASDRTSGLRNCSMSRCTPLRMRAHRSDELMMGCAGVANADGPAGKLGRPGSPPRTRPPAGGGKTWP